jgi:hypothetical protein
LQERGIDYVLGVEPNANHTLVAPGVYRLRT